MGGGESVLTTSKAILKDPQQTTHQLCLLVCFSHLIQTIDGGHLDELIESYILHGLDIGNRNSNSNTIQ